jgi:thermitase
LPLLVLPWAVPLARALAAEPAPEPPSVPGEIVVGFRTRPLEPADAGRRVWSVGRLLAGNGALKAYRVRVKPQVPLAAALAELRARPDVRYAEPNYLFQVGATPNDPGYSQQYALRVTRTDQAWDVWSPRGTIRIAIVDTGVQSSHPDLTNNIYRLNGAVVGRDFVNNDNDPSDDHGHGTHCAGIAAAQINNGAGVAGIAGWTGTTGVTDTATIQILPVKVLGSAGSGPSTAIANGIVWAADNGADVISLSLGLNVSVSVINDAVQYAWNRGCVVVAAAGNAGSSAVHYPAGHDNVLSVGATDANDTLTSFSNWGSWVKTAAPGAAIYSTLRNGGYGSMSGTSMACPFVAGEVALLWAHAPGLTNQNWSTSCSPTPTRTRPSAGGRSPPGRAASTCTPPCWRSPTRVRRRSAPCRSARTPCGAAGPRWEP